MFKKLIKLNHKLVNLRFCSQVVETTDKLNKIEDKNSVKSKEGDKSVSEKSNHEIDIQIKTDPQYMDRIFELNLNYSHKKEYNHITDPYFEAHQPLKDKLKFILYPRPDRRSTFVGFKKVFKELVDYREENQNKYVSRRHSKLGPDLAVANFIVVRGGRVRFKHAPNVWATHLDHFPDRYDPRFRVVGVDASHTKLRNEGIDNFQEMNSLEELNLSNNKLDDWSCDQIARLFRNSKLVSLDLSNNPLITHRGIETLHKIRSLNTLNIRGTKAAKYPFLELLILSFNDVVVDCNVVYE